MGKKKSLSRAMKFSEVFPKEICATLDAIGNYIVVPEYGSLDKAKLSITKQVNINEIKNLYWASEILPTSQEVDEAQAFLIQQIHAKWDIALYWVAYEMLPSVDITKSPYLKPEFKAFRNFGSMLYSFQQLCKGCFEQDPQFRNHYLNPLNAWIHILREMKVRDVWNTLQVPTHSPISDEYESEKLFVKTIEQGRLPDSLNGETRMVHFRRVLTTALHLQGGQKNFNRREEFRSKYWGSWLYSLKQNLRDRKRQNSALEFYFSKRGKLYVQQRSYQRAIRVPEASQKLSPIGIFAFATDKQEITVGLNRCRWTDCQASIFPSTKSDSEQDYL